jgi:cysteine-rich repeat protein
MGLMLAALASPAPAQIDCGPGGALCTTTKYGLGLKPEYRKDEVPEAQFRYTDAYFGPNLGGVSYFVGRGDVTGAIGNCGPHRRHSPFPGQILLRELTDCVPTSEGPVCTAGTNVGKPCHLPTLNEGCTGAGAPLACCLGAGSGTCAGFQASAANTLECGTGGTCTLDPGIGCRVEIPISYAGDIDPNTGERVTPIELTSEGLIFALTSNAPASNGDTFSINALTGFGFGGTSEDDLTTADGDIACLQSAIRRRPSSGTRYVLPINRGGDGTAAGGTYIRWDSAKGIPEDEIINHSTSLRFHSDDSGVCCAAGNPSLGTCTVVVQAPTPNYPLLTVRDCSFPARFTNNDNVQPDWIFEGGPRETARFYTDPDFVLPGQIPGLCTVNASTPCFAPGSNANSLCVGNRNPYSCCTGAGTGNCTQDCSGLDADPATPGLQPDTCNLRQAGMRTQVQCNRTSSYDSRTDCCATAMIVLRGVPNQGCSILTRYPYAGDPGPDCGVSNFGINHRDDANCNGIDDQIDAGSSDLCPFYTEWDQDLDSDGDCAISAARCRGDECECGDQSGTGLLSGTVDVANGVVNVSDLVGINSAIFGVAVRKRLCDANADTLCNVSDIIGANKEVFVPDSSICRHITPRQCLTGVPAPCCGNGLLEPPELCDDGDLAPGDGCNASCRVEFGFTCTPTSPSVCS